MVRDTTALRSQNAALTFGWGNVRIDLLRFRQTIRTSETTGAGSGTDAKHIPGVRVRTFAATGIVINGTPDFTTEVAQIKVDFTGDNSKVIDCPACVLSEQEFTINFKQGGDIKYRCVAVVDGPMTITGAP